MSDKILYNNNGEQIGEVYHIPLSINGSCFFKYWHVIPINDTWYRVHFEEKDFDTVPSDDDPEPYMISAIHVKAASAYKAAIAAFRVCVKTRSPLKLGNHYMKDWTQHININE